MNLSRPTQTTLVLSLCLAAMAGTQSYEHYRLTQLNTNLAETAGKKSLDILLTRLDQFDQQLAEADKKYVVSNDDFRSGQQALSSRLDAIENLTQKARESVEQLELGSASAEDLATLKASVDSVANQLKDLQSRLTKSAATNPSIPASSSRKNASGTKARHTPTPPLFDLLGIEHRGGQEFLAVAPRGSTQLHQINLIRPGDTVMGTGWKLSSLEGTSAKFDVAGTSQTVALAP